MLKLLKSVITGLETDGNETIGLNSNYRTRMGYNDSTKTINVVVEKIVRPELTREEEVPITYEEVAERNFTISDFVKDTDNKIWIVDFDVSNQTILDPIDVWKYTQDFRSADYSHTYIFRKLIETRYNENLIPLFVLHDFYKNSNDFVTSTICFQIKTPGETEEASESVITNESVDTVTIAQRLQHTLTQQTHVFYEILDENNEPIDCDIQALVQTVNPGLDKVRGNQFEVDLPKNSSYKLRVNYFRGLADKNIECRFDANCINGISSKDRLIAKFNENKPCPDYSYLGDGYQTWLSARYVGYDIVTISNSLEVGDFIKFKLDCGQQLTYSELKINLI